MLNAQKILMLLQSVADSSKALEMAAYMKNQFDFLGVATPLRRKICNPVLNSAKFRDIDWAFIDACWDSNYREMQYVATDYLNKLTNKLTPSDLPRIEQLVTHKSWWDTVDALDKVVGGIYLNFPQIRPQLILWSKHDNIWLRRIAIDCQLSFKQQTDSALLGEIIMNNLGEKEFFINKAIGWALREYGKTNPNWIKMFIQQHRTKMSPLSVREAMKRLRD